MLENPAGRRWAWIIHVSQTAVVPAVKWKRWIPLKMPLFLNNIETGFSIVCSSECTWPSSWGCMIGTERGDGFFIISVPDTKFRMSLEICSSLVPCFASCSLKASFSLYGRAVCLSQPRWHDPKPSTWWINKSWLLPHFRTMQHHSYRWSHLSWQEASLQLSCSMGVKTCVLSVISWSDRCNRETFC